MAFLSNVKEEQFDATGIVNSILNDGIKESVSDIHFQPLSTKMIVRFRLDGALSPFYECSLEEYKLIISRIKVMASLDITGPNHPQEGHISFRYDNRDVDFRVSIFPTSNGEAAVLRILESSDNFQSYKDLGLSEEQVATFEEISHRPYGLVLVTGPTGSGKSTTLFTTLKKLNTPERSLVTLEDPVERRLEMVRQSEIVSEIGFTFAEGLRYLLRQDPDVLMVGEIRDRETARIAVQAAITGHLVLATTHTNNAASAVVRLINMGVEPYLLASALKMVSSQRLASRLCSECKTAYSLDDDIVKKYSLSSDMNLMHAEGCFKCNSRGTKGRIGLHEVLVIDKEIKRLIVSQPSDEQINESARKNGMKTLRQSAMEKVSEGVISLEEAIRLTE